MTASTKPVLSYEVRDQAAVLTMDRPPVNALNEQLRRELVEAVRRAEDDPAVLGIVLRGGAKTFSAGADITEFGGQPAQVTVRDVVATLSGSSKPVAAALTGTVFGGGLEVALGAHFRVCSTSATLALPEVRLGLVPGAGGTQAIARVLPGVAAVSFVAEGFPRSAEQVWAISGQRLIDSLTQTDDECVSTAIATVLRASQDGTPPTVADRQPDSGDPQELQRAVDKVRRRSRGAAAPLACVELVTMAFDGADFDEGLAREAERFNQLKTSTESHAMRHVFFAERQAPRVDDLPSGVEPLPVGEIGVVGAGTMGVGIAVCFLAAGYPVTLVDLDEQALNRARETIEAHFESQARQGLMDVVRARASIDAVTLTPQSGELRDADVIIEAVFEDIEVKAKVLKSIDQIAAPTAVIASNTSTLDLDRLATAVSVPDRVVGMHFFSPAQLMPLLEVIRAETTSPVTLKTALSLGKRIGKVPVAARVCDGFIGNRLLAKYREAAIDALWAGVYPTEVDKAVEAFGFAMGPFRMADMAGNDIGWAVRKRRYLEHLDAPRDLISDALCESGRLGQKVGAGWYDYPDGGRRPARSAEVETLIDRLRAEHRGSATQSVTGDEIVHRMVGALVDEGYRVLEEGIAQRASDIDVVYVNGYGFPRHRGGPMYYASEIWGLTSVISTLRDAYGATWEPARGLAAACAQEKEGHNHGR